MAKKKPAATPPIPQKTVYKDRFVMRLQAISQELEQLANELKAAKVQGSPKAKKRNTTLIT